jgi:hypothetical protein
MFKSAENEIIVSTKRLARADKHRCFAYDLVEVKVLEETDNTIVELLTYRDMSNKVLYTIKHGGIKGRKRFNGRSSVKLERKNKKK